MMVGKNRMTRRSFLICIRPDDRWRPAGGLRPGRAGWRRRPAKKDPYPRRSPWNSACGCSRSPIPH